MSVCRYRPQDGLNRRDVEMVNRKSAGPACRSPLVSQPRTGKADEKTRKHWPAGVSGVRSKLRRKFVRICSDGK